MNNIKGVTLIELMVAIGIMAIMFAIAIPNYVKWRNENNMESDVRKIYATLNKFRSKAFTQKTGYTVDINGSIIVEDKASNTIESVNLKYDFVSNSISIDKRGTYSGGNIYPQNTEIHPQYNCIAVDDTRVKLGFANDSSGCNW